MEEILEALKRTTLEKGPQKLFYSNLSVTKPLQDSALINTVLLQGFDYLTRSWLTELSQTQNSSSSSSTEIYTSLLALDLLGSKVFPFLTSLENCQEQLCTQFLSTLHTFICPDFGLSSFNLFKVEDHMSDDVKKILPDDVNTTALAVSVLYRDELLGQKPAENIVRLLLDNYCEENGGILFFLQSSNEESEEELNNFVDLATCANVLRLLYQMDMHYEAIELENYILSRMKNWKECTDSFQNAHIGSDSFLYFLCRALKDGKDNVKEKFLPYIESRVVSSLNETKISTLSCIQTSLKILMVSELSSIDHTMVHTGLPNVMKQLQQHLLSMQNENNGSWPVDLNFFRVPTNNNHHVPFGSKALSTIFAMKAIHACYYEYSKRQRLDYMENLSVIY